jgi:CRP-like cAMP-binding protein
MRELKELITSKTKLDSASLEEILLLFEERTVKKGAHLLQKGQLCTQYYFIKEGCVRIYLKEAVEITGWIAFENEFFSELASLKKQVPTQFYIQAIENTKLHVISKQNMDVLYERFPEWQGFGREIWEDAFLRVIDGIIAHQTLSAEAKYVRLLERTDAIQRIPLKYLASFLGITPTSLSRIRKSITRS